MGCELFKRTCNVASSIKVYSQPININSQALYSRLWIVIQALADCAFAECFEHLHDNADLF
jgi:hypothetical protein